MARKLTPEEKARLKADFDPPPEPAAAKPKAKKNKASEYVPPKKLKLPSEIEKELSFEFSSVPARRPAPAPKKRGHKSPWPEGTELQRVNVFLPVASARRLRAVAAMRGVDLGVVLNEFIEQLKVE